MSRPPPLSANCMPFPQNLWFIFDPLPSLFANIIYWSPLIRTSTYDGRTFQGRGGVTYEYPRLCEIERECLDSTRRIFARHPREVCANAEGSLEYTHMHRRKSCTRHTRARTEYDTDWPLDDVLNIYDKYGATCSLFGRGGKLIISV